MNAHTNSSYVPVIVILPCFHCHNSVVCIASYPSTAMVNVAIRLDSIMHLYWHESRYAVQQAIEICNKLIRIPRNHL